MPSARYRCRDVEDRPLLARRHVHRPRALAPGDEQVAQADVRERAAHHHLVVPASRAVGVEVLALDAVLGQVVAGRAVGLDRARRRDVVGRDGVAEHDEAARAVDVLDRPRLGRHPVEVRRQAHVRRVGLPVEEVALGHRHPAPGLVARVDVGVAAAEELAGDGRGDRLPDLLRGRPEVAEVDVVAVGVLADRLGVEVDVHPPGERVGDDERRRGQVVRLHLGMDARLEVAVARRGRRRRRGRSRSPPGRSPRAAARSSRCRSCSRSRPCGSRAPRGTASGRPSRSSR